MTYEKPLDEKLKNTDPKIFLIILGSFMTFTFLFGFLFSFLENLIGTADEWGFNTKTDEGIINLAGVSLAVIVLIIGFIYGNKIIYSQNEKTGTVIIGAYLVGATITAIFTNMIIAFLNLFNSLLETPKGPNLSITIAFYLIGWLSIIYWINKYSNDLRKTWS